MKKRTNAVITVILAAAAACDEPTELATTEWQAATSSTVAEETSGSSAEEAPSPNDDYAQQQNAQFLELWSELQAQMFAVLEETDVEIEFACDGGTTVASLVQRNIPGWGSLTLRYEPSAGMLEVLSTDHILLRYDTVAEAIEHETLSTLLREELVDLSGMAVLSGYLILMSEKWAENGDVCGFRGASDVHLMCDGISVAYGLAGLVFTVVGQPILGYGVGLLGQGTSYLCHYVVNKACENGGCQSTGPEPEPPDMFGEICVIGQGCVPPRPRPPWKKLVLVP